MEDSRQRIAEKELDLIEMMDEIIVESSSLQAFMQMALDLICFGLKRSSGALISLPNLRQEKSIKVWHNPDSGWLPDGESLSTSLTDLVANVQSSGQIREVEGLIGIPVTNRKKQVATLILSRADPLPVEEETLEILCRLIGQRIRHFQASAATVDRDQLNALLRTATNADGKPGKSNDLPSEIARELLRTFKAQALILLLTPNDGSVKLKRLVLMTSGNWQEYENIEFTSGLLYDCASRNELTQWNKIRDLPRRNDAIDIVEGAANNSLVGVPLMAEGQKVGVLGILDSQLFPLDQTDQSLLMSVCSNLAHHTLNAALVEKNESIYQELLLKKSEAANTRSALRVLFESTPFLFYIINQEFRIAAINTPRANLADSPSSDLIGKVCFEALYHNNEICSGCLVSATLQTGQSTNRQKRTWNKDDTASDWEVNCYPINNARGKTIQAVIVEQDITEKRQMEAELLQNEKLVATGQLAASVAHEINNPLAAVIANAQILLKDIPPEKEDLIESVKLIELAGLRASHVVKNLLGLARKEEYEFTPVDINESIQDALSLLSHEFVARPIAIRFERGQNLPPIIASREHLESIWINLLMNSIEAIEGESGSIEINTFYDDGSFYVLIRDSGVGIPEEQLGRIFEPFYTTKIHERGTGLGLSVVNRIVKAHSGSIQVDSEVGKGTTFTVILPEMQPGYVLNSSGKNEDQIVPI